LGSTNGTQVNGISISDAELMDGAEIRFAYVTGVFQNAIASIAHATELQLPGEHDCPAPLRIPETQAIFGERAQTRDDHPHDPRQQ
jgi:pSer/pThr/pTyr-binding forkhead associated (FHA) protein